MKSMMGFFLGVALTTATFNESLITDH